MTSAKNIPKLDAEFKKYEVIILKGKEMKKAEEVRIQQKKERERIE